MKFEQQSKDLLLLNERPGHSVHDGIVFGEKGKILVDETTQKIEEAVAEFSDGTTKKFIFDLGDGKVSSVISGYPDGSILWDDPEAVMKALKNNPLEVSLQKEGLLNQGGWQGVFTEYDGRPVSQAEAEAELIRLASDELGPQ